MIDPAYYSKQYAYAKRSLEQTEDNIATYTRIIDTNKHPYSDRQLTDDERAKFTTLITKMKLSLIDQQKLLAEYIEKGKRNGEHFIGQLE